ncbi:MAG: peptidase, partial [Actinomycetales bacterium]
MKKSLRRGLVATAATALGAGLLAVPAAQADTSRTPQTVNAADWLSGQVIDGVLVNEAFGDPFIDWGLTLDTLFALDSVGGYNAKVADIADALAEDLGSYIGTGEESYGGSTAKALVAAQAAGKNPADFGGTDLVGATEARVDGTGRLADESAFGNFANVFGQAFAVKGLHAADS